MDIQSENNKFLTSADSWLRNSGIMSDFHKNQLILYSLLIADTANDAELVIDTKKMNIDVFLYYSRWKLFFIRKQKLIDNLMFFYKQNFPSWSFNIELKIK